MRCSNDHHRGQHISKHPRCKYDSIFHCTGPFMVTGDADADDTTRSGLTAKRRAEGAPRSLPICPAALPRGRRLGCRLLLALELLACLLGTLLQLLLQLLLLLLEFLGIGRRTVIGLGKILERNHETDGLAGAIDPLNDEALPFLQLADEFTARFVVGHATVVEAAAVRSGHGLAVVDDDPGAGLNRHA